jgi:tetratricopeptide (TPR) repeat protein
MINESIQLANTYTNIGNVHDNSDDHANALEYYNKAVDIHSKIKE